MSGHKSERLSSNVYPSEFQARRFLWAARPGSLLLTFLFDLFASNLRRIYAKQNRRGGEENSRMNSLTVKSFCVPFSGCKKLFRASMADRNREPDSTPKPINHVAFELAQPMGEWTECKGFQIMIRMTVVAPKPTET